MPKNTTPLPQDALDDDDEIVDLLEVVKPGKNVSGTAPSASEHDDSADFSADLDAMLDELSKEGTPDEPSVPQPFPDPTPVNHTVDANEELSLPSMDDLDNLLQTLGVDKAAVPPAEDIAEEAAGNEVNAMDAMPMEDPAADPLEECVDAPLQKVPVPAPEEPPPPVVAKEEPALAAEQETPASVPVDLEDLPFLAQPAAGATPSTPEEDSLAPESVPAPEDVPDSESVPVHEGSSASEDGGKTAGNTLAEADLFEETPAEVAVPATVSEDLFDQAVQAASKSAEPAASVASETEARGEVDLNELDALLDDMLASAPTPGAMPAGAANSETTAAAPAVDVESRIAGVEESLDILNSTMTTELRAGLAEARADLARLHVAVQRQEELSSPGGIPDDVRAELDSLHSGLAEARLAGEQFPAVRGELDSLRENLRDLDTHIASFEGAPTDAAALEAKEAVITELRAAVESQAGEIAALREELADIRGGLDKIAAEAAAKIIREEIAFLLQHVGKE